MSLCNNNNINEPASYSIILARIPRLNNLKRMTNLFNIIDSFLYPSYTNACNGGINRIKTTLFLDHIQRIS